MHERTPGKPAGGREADRASRAQVLSVLRAERRAVTSSEVAGRLGLHANTVRLHLEHLVQAGLATREPLRREGPGRPRSGYAAVAVPEFEPSAGDPQDDERGYLLLAEILASHLESTAPQPAEAAAVAGRAWGRALAGRAAEGAGAGGSHESVRQATDDLAGLMEELGFAPRSAVPGETLELYRCPFGQVAERHSAVVCAVHLGLMQGALLERDAPLRAASVEPFVTPDMCLARFHEASSSKRPSGS